MGDWVVVGRGVGLGVGSGVGWVGLGVVGLADLGVGVEEVEVASPAVLLDVDTPEDYRRLLEEAGGGG